MQTPLRSGLLALLFVAGPAAIAPVQAQDQPARATSGAVELATEPFRLDSVGLSIHLPAGAIAQTTRAGEHASVQIMPSGPDPVWLVNLQTPQSTDLKRSPQDVAEEVLNQLLASVGVLDRQVRGGELVDRLVSTRGTVIEPVRPFELADAPAEQRLPAARFYVRVPRGERESAVIRGYTIFQTAPGRYITFDLVTTEPHFATSRRSYETMVATARFEDTSAASARRGAAIDAGIDLLGRLSPADYEAALAAMNDRWFRLANQPSGTSDRDAEEIAYRRIRAWKGNRSEIEHRQPPSGGPPVAGDEGYLIRIDARSLQGGDGGGGGQTIDSIGIYFMSTDRREEAWTLQMAIRDTNRRHPSTWTETGARSGRSMSVTTTGTGEQNVAATPFIPDQGYLTQVENFLLPYLIVNADRPGDYGFYVYQSETNNVRLRRDTLTRDESGEKWLLTTQHNEDRPAQVSTYDASGDFVQTALTDSVIWTPTTLKQLADLWRGKGLPMD
jgi:hypothetical protein